MMSLGKNISAVINRACKSVVRIYTSSSVGAGVIVSNDAIIITNEHVIEGGPKIKIETIEGQILNAFMIVKIKRYDIAFLFVKSSQLGSGISVVKLPDRVNYSVGDTVFAIGHPQGLNHTVTRGIVSAVNRKILSGNFPVMIYGLKWIQTDTPVSRGHSGGPLINDRGEMVGLNTWIASSADGKGINFSLPAGYFVPWISYLKDYLNPKRRIYRLLCPICGSFSSLERYYCTTCGAKLNFDIRRKELLHKLKRTPVV